MTDRGWGRGAQDGAGPRASRAAGRRSLAAWGAASKVLRVNRVYFLAGSSYPGDRDVEVAVTRRLNSAGIEVVSQADILAMSRARTQPRDPAVRVEQLRRAIERSPPGPPPFVIGRSSGAQVATLASLQFDLAGVICLAYPFRPKGRVLEPARFAHLADLRTPTLIIQGERDGYGGRGLTREYRLSPQVACGWRRPTTDSSSTSPTGIARQSGSSTSSPAPTPAAAGWTPSTRTSTSPPTPRWPRGSERADTHRAGGISSFRARSKAAPTGC